MKFVRCIEARGGSFTSVVHPTAVIGPNVSIGVGCIIAPGTTVTADCAIGSHVILNVGVSVSHDCQVQRGVTISPGCHIAGWCTVGENSFLGIHSALIPHVTLGPCSYVAAGAVVTTSHPAGTRLMGVPAKAR
jgi:sugar O-acyltransferase (sialic acid O-acetyltransferase NeuD family)